jgi:hypothetical protein
VLCEWIALLRGLVSAPEARSQLTSPQARFIMQGVMAMAPALRPKNFRRLYLGQLIIVSLDKEQMLGSFSIHHKFDFFYSCQFGVILCAGNRVIH